MKRIVATAFAAVLLITIGCKKDTPIITAANITGQWQWTSTLFDSPLSLTNPSTPLNGGTAWSINFYNDNTWSKKVLGILSDTGTYSVGHRTYTNSSDVVVSYDSVAYFHSATLLPFNADYYKIYNNDSLVFNTSFAGYVGGANFSFAK